MERDIELVRRCHTLISRIAALGACTSYSALARDLLFDLVYELSKLREPAGGWSETEASNGLRRLERLHRRLAFIDSTSEGLTACEILREANRSTWN